MYRALLLSLFVLFIFSACNNFGEKLSRDYLEVYYLKDIKESEAQKTLDFLYPAWKADSGETERKSVQLSRSADTVIFRMVTNDEKIEKVGDEVLYMLGNVFSDSLFAGAPVNIQLADDQFKPIRTLYFRKLTGPDFGEKLSFENIEVYRKDGFSAAEAQRLAEFLARTDTSANEKSFQVTRSADGPYQVSMVSNPSAIASVPEAEFRQLAANISDSVFAGASTVLHLTDNRFTVIKTIPYKAAE